MADSGLTTFSGRDVAPPSKGKHHFLHIDDFSKEELSAMLNTGLEVKRKIQAGDESYKPFAGLTMAMIFTKPSMRTRISFETVSRTKLFCMAVQSSRSTFLLQSRSTPVVCSAWQTVLESAMQLFMPRRRSKCQTALQPPALSRRTVGEHSSPSGLFLPTLQGFYKLGGHAIYLGPDTIQMGKREATKDIARVISRCACSPAKRSSDLRHDLQETCMT